MFQSKVQFPHYLQTTRCAHPVLLHLHQLFNLLPLPPPLAQGNQKQHPQPINEKWSTNFHQTKDKTQKRKDFANWNFSEETPIDICHQDLTFTLQNERWKWSPNKTSWMRIWKTSKERKWERANTNLGFFDWRNKRVRNEEMTIYLNQIKKCCINQMKNCFVSNGKLFLVI